MEETDGQNKDIDSDSNSEMNEDEKIRKEAARLKGHSSEAIAKFQDYRVYLHIFLE